MIDNPNAGSVEPFAAAIAGRYAIGRELGRGGMATVYLANDLKHGREVALKILRPDVASAIGANRFLREIEVVARLNHPHIVPLYDSGEIDPLQTGAPPFLYYVMPFVRGESLRARLDRERRLPLDEALRMARQIASALHYAHSQNLIHRDVKPENILLHEGEAMVADFGIARFAKPSDGSLTQTGIIVGTAGYMSPEQVAGETSIDASSDVYSLGCVLFEMLAGQPPFTGPTAVAVMTRHLVDPIPSVRRLRPDVPLAVERAIMTAMARLAADRFSTALAFSEALSAPVIARTGTRSVAVLPFLNMSPDPDNEYFADGITEDVIAHLSKVRSLEVIARSSVMPFKKREHGVREIASRLQVATVLDGSVRRAGDRVRIVAQLIDAKSEKHLWTETYDHHLTDIFAIQTDVALKIAAALRAELTGEERTRIGREPTSDVRAYQLYLQGRHFYTRFTREGMQKSIEYFEQAIRRDPDYALAFSGIVLAYAELAETGGMNPAEAYDKAKPAALKALAIDPESGEAHCALGYLRFIADFDWKGADDSFKRAIELNPGAADSYDLYGRLLSSLGRYDEAVAMAQRAHDLDPHTHRVDLVTALLRAGRYDEAVHLVTFVLHLDPNEPRARATLGWALILQHLYDQGIAELERAAAAAPGDSGWFAQLGEAYGIAGHSARAREVLDRLQEISRQRYVSPYHMAYVHTGLGEADAAIDWLERAYDERAGAIYGVKGSFLFAPLRGHPRFTNLLRKMNLGDSTLTTNPFARS